MAKKTEAVEIVKKDSKIEELTARVVVLEELLEELAAKLKKQFGV